MNVREAVHRLHEQVDLYFLRWQQPKRDKACPQYDAGRFSFCVGETAQLPALKWDTLPNQAEAESLFEGHWSALGFDWRWRADNDWHRAPDTAKSWPESFFAAIPYRAGNPYGDIRVAWEPARLQQLLSLALLAADEVYRERAIAAFEAQLLSWLKANPAYRGIHYVSAMECGLRLLAVCHAVDMVRPYLKQPDIIWSAVLSLVESHAALIVRRLSLHSSSGNHTIAECAGLVYAGTLFPEFAGAARWRSVGLELLEQEAQRQFLPDGGGIEQAFSYHLFITDLCNLVARLLASTGTPSRILDQTVDTAIGFLSSFFSADWQLPNIGDNDGGYALSRHLRISYRRSQTVSGVTTFADSGYTLIQDVGAQDRLLVFDHGPLGMAPSYGHGHSDCLSVFWRERGEALLIDPGTYTYTGDPRWRRYFRGVSAHNTVSVGGQDQAVQQSAFMWSLPFGGHLLEAPAEINGYTVLLASHNGYLRLGLMHYRAVIYSDGNTLVWDCLQPHGAVQTPQEVSLWWHLAGTLEPGAAHDNRGRRYQLRGTQGASLQLELQGGDIFCYSADEAGPHGWNSPIYGKKCPIWTLEARHNGTFPHEFYSYISSSSDTISLNKEGDFETIINRLRVLTLCTNNESR